MSTWSADGSSRRHHRCRVQPVLTRRRLRNRLASVSTAQNGATGVAFDGTNIWVADTFTNVVYKIDPNTNNVITVDIGRSSYGVGFDGTNIWATSSGSNSVSKIDPNTNNVANIDIGQTSKRVAFDGTNIWATSGDDTVTKIVPF